MWVITRYCRKNPVFGVPRSGFFVMGDSLRDSYASRVFGFIGRSNLREMCDRVFC
ncbi:MULTISPECIES: S26 family signal peptidase [unclassified Microcoleus]|uniref:S26 family signal peptidase n=1 Tax=unclassified Microcoleus TaxID=2642155 RepID=UPI004040B087